MTRASHIAFLVLLLLHGTRLFAAPTLILHNAKVITSDKAFSIHQAIAITNDRITAVGPNTDVLKLKGPNTQLIDLAGKSILPGLIDSHTHPSSAAMTEADHEIPPMESIDDVLAYIKERATKLKEGQWIDLRQVFITRLREQRYPTRAELDSAAPHHPVIFSTGPDASLNSLALKLSNIDRNTAITDGGPGFIEKDPAGEPTGILRSCTRIVKFQAPPTNVTEETRQQRLLQLFADYNASGITSIADRNADRSAIARYRKLLDANQLTVRLSLSHQLDTIGPLDKTLQRIKDIAQDPLCADHPMLRIVGVKTFLDGGMLTGSAYMREPWGVSKTYAITDPTYRGVLFIPKERLLPIVRTTVESKLQFTAHSVGDGAVHALLDAYAEIDKTTPIRATRPCITHCNFMSPQAIDQMQKLGVVADIQPAWLYLDTRTLAAQFGLERLRFFQPLASLFNAGVIVGGGSDHMQKIGPLRSVNPYSPFLAMHTAITRQPKWFEGPLHPQESLTREQAIRFYTSNNAHLLFRDHHTGSLEPGKFADLIILDKDPLTCSLDELKDIQVLTTYLAGKPVFQRN